MDRRYAGVFFFRDMVHSGIAVPLRQNSPPEKSR